MCCVDHAGTIAFFSITDKEAIANEAMVVCNAHNNPYIPSARLQVAVHKTILLTLYIDLYKLLHISLFKFYVVAPEIADYNLRKCNRGQRIGFWNGILLII